MFLFDFELVNCNYFFGLYLCVVGYFVGFDLLVYGCFVDVCECELLRFFFVEIVVDVMDGSYCLFVMDGFGCDCMLLCVVLKLFFEVGYEFDGMVLCNCVIRVFFSFEILVMICD